MKRYKLQDTSFKLIISLGLIALFFTLSAFPLSIAYAASPTPKATTTPSPSPTADPNDIGQKLEQLKEEISSKAAELKNQVTQKIQNKAYLGQITSISDKEIDITATGGKRVILINQYTAYQDSSSSAKAKKALTYQDYKVNEYIVGLGDVDDKNNLNAKKVIKIKAPVADTTTFSWGKLTKVESTALTLEDHLGQKSRFTLDEDSIIKSSQDDVILSQLKLDSILAVASLKNYAQFVYTSSQVAPKPSATASASPSTKASTTPKVTPKPTPK